MLLSLFSSTSSRIFTAAISASVTSSFVLVSLTSVFPILALASLASTWKGIVVIKKETNVTIMIDLLKFPILSSPPLKLLIFHDYILSKQSK
ncbi:hypothetical protein SDC9_81922 [bioreactor metagenome]|uniref:Uncharacterized protein n=1 Tax=bioreactor metagenome TaxID=1076179 RepID=A0A644Z3G5_9ZZZZ